MDISLATWTKISIFIYFDNAKGLNIEQNFSYSYSHQIFFVLKYLEI
jgi:hypothetical protein